MKRVIYMTLALLIVLAMSVLTFDVAVAQDENMSIPEGFPLLLILPWAIGTLAHWYKKYVEDAVAYSFGNWFLKNIGWTIGSLGVGWIAILAIYNLNPLSFIPGNPAAWIQLFMIGLAADSLNKSSK